MRPAPTPLAQAILPAAPRRAAPTHQLPQMMSRAPGRTWPACVAKGRAWLKCAGGKLRQLCQAPPRSLADKHLHCAATPPGSAHLSKSQRCEPPPSRRCVQQAAGQERVSGWAFPKQSDMRAAAPACTATAQGQARRIGLCAPSCVSACAWFVHKSPPAMRAIQSAWPHLQPAAQGSRAAAIQRQRTDQCPVQAHKGDSCSP